MDAHIREYVDKHLIPLAYRGLELLEQLTPPGRRTVKNTLVTCSGGLSVTLVPDDMPIVLQVFLEDVYSKVKTFCQEVERLSLEQYLARPVSYYDDEHAISFRKVIPLNQFTADMEQTYQSARTKIEDISEDVGEALQALHQFELAHGDPSLDNIGYDTEARRFVLFDFDKSITRATDHEKSRDFHQFQTSMHRSLNGVAPPLGSF